VLSPEAPGGATAAVGASALNTCVTHRSACLQLAWLTIPAANVRETTETTIDEPTRACERTQIDVRSQKEEERSFFFKPSSSLSHDAFQVCRNLLQPYSRSSSRLISALISSRLVGGVLPLLCGIGLLRGNELSVAATGGGKAEGDRRRESGYARRLIIQRGANESLPATRAARQVRLWLAGFAR